MAEELLFGESAPKQKVEPIDEGDYEFEIVSHEYQKSKTSGTRQLVFKFKIREDVEQKFKGRYLFYTISEKSGDRSFNFYWINSLIVATKNCPGYKEIFKLGFDEVLQFLIGRQFRGHVIVEEYTDASGENVKRNRVDGRSLTQSQWNGNESVEVADSDLPF